MIRILANRPRTSFRTWVLISLAAWTPLIWASPLFSQGASRAAEFHSGPGLVLLTNGEVLEGQIQPFDREIEIRIDETATVRSSYDRVAYIGQSMDELYLFQANRITQWGYGDHLQLGRWCAQHKLFERAMPHYEYLKAEIPNRTEFKRFKAELSEAMMKDQNVQVALTAAGIPVPTNSDEAGAPAPPQTPSQVALASQANKSKQAIRVDTNSQEVFRRDIQPILAASCARTACHGTFSDNRLKLLDMSRVRPKDTLAQNLSAFATYLSETKGDPDSDPEQHPIYQKAVSPHGKLLQSPLDVNDPKHQRFMEQLRLWIARTNSEQSQSSLEVANASPSNSIAPAAPAIQPASDLWTKAHAYEDKQGLAAKARAATSNEPPVLNGKEMSGIAAAIAKLEEIEHSRTAKKDPFDPAEFNAKFASKPTVESTDGSVKK